MTQPLPSSSKTSSIWRKLSAPLAAALILSGFFVWYEIGLQPVTGEHGGNFRIGQGEGAQIIAAHLEEQGFIRNRQAFLVYAAFHGLLRRMQRGVYTIPNNTSTGLIAEMMAHGQVHTKQLTIPEGVTLAKIRDLAAAQGIKEADFNLALTANYSNAFLATRPHELSLEGYLFPDSYTVGDGTTAEGLMKVMLETFGSKVASYEPAFARQGMTLHQGITLASVIEKEVANETDRRIVAGIFTNRLKAGQPLQSDVTVNYAATLLGTSFDTNLNSPYNTYKNAGLPVGPICNPGLSAIEAAANPASTDYSYFLAGKDGKTYYAKTFAEHEQNIARYLQ